MVNIVITIVIAVGCFMLGFLFGQYRKDTKW